MSLRDIYARYSDDIQILMIYIREAHPADGFSPSSHGITQHRTIKERREVAGMCELTLQYGIPTLVDEMDDEVMKAYAALPDRLYLVGKDGRIAYASGRGPFGFKPTELSEAIDRELELISSGEVTPA